MPVACPARVSPILNPATALMALLLNHLKEYRQTRSAAEKVPIYCVFGDTVIRSLAQDRPATKQALLGIRGLTEEKCERYGDDIISIIRRFTSIAPASYYSRGSRALQPVVVRHGPRYTPARRRQPALPPDLAQSRAATKRVPGIPAGKEGIYVLELAKGRVYVGHSTDVKRRIQQHMAGQGAAFTKAFPPTGVLLPRLGCVTGSSEAAERDETLRYMFLRGIPFVRGWKFVQVHLTDRDVQDAEENIRELFDLCRRCGHPGHFVTHCKANFDRFGRPCATK
jgi:predicted GIY-YIG superfamily endonuclease